MSIYAFVPLRAGGKRAGFDKETALLGGYPLLSYTIDAAFRSGIFERVYAVTCSEKHAALAAKYGARILDRPVPTVADDSPDIEWLFWALQTLWVDYLRPERFCILRVTSPFRTAETIKRAWLVSKDLPNDSFRMMRPAGEHPGKMWVQLSQGITVPLLPCQPTDRRAPWHSSPTQTLPPVLVQTGGLEIGNVLAVLSNRVICGPVVHPFMAQGHEGLDINTRMDFVLAQLLLKGGEVKLDPPEERHADA